MDQSANLVWDSRMSVLGTESVREMAHGKVTANVLVTKNIKENCAMFVILDISKRTKTIKPSCAVNVILRVNQSAPVGDLRVVQNVKQAGQVIKTSDVTISTSVVKKTFVRPISSVLTLKVHIVVCNVIHLVMVVMVMDLICVKNVLKVTN
uniref:Uncharacterized protein n=1 Tax=Cacopsylla melanoneura TaxID=428564 RepID=A0A8D9BED6_9HEMI